MAFELAFSGTSVAAALVALSLLWLSTRSRKPHPPGPKPKFLIGNLKDLPSKGYEWVKYAAMTREYASDVLYFTVLGTPLLVINSFEAARELLDKKGALYSSRPRLVMIKELMRYDWNLLLMSYGKTFVAQRRIVQQEFQPAVVTRLHRPVIVREVTALLSRLLATPDVGGPAMVDHFRHLTGAIIMMTTYGHQATSAKDRFIQIAEIVREHAESRPGFALVDLCPPLKYLPTWFPGASFHRQAAIERALSVRMRSEPYQDVKERMATGDVVSCLATRLLAQDDLPWEGTGLTKDEFVRDCCGDVYSAGADTAIVAMRNFVLAMILFPGVQECAQEELDRVVGRDRLPTFDDRAQLPYVSNVVKESLRWKAVSNLGVPHATLDSDEYRGGYIPKGTTVLANLYAMLHDESVYAEPDEFNPDRYAPTPAKPSGEPDPACAAFGFGRRVCPGRYFADDTLFLTMASLLHVFRIANAEGATGPGAVKDVHWSSGLVSHPSPFPAMFTPRFGAAGDVVHAAQL
uniref:Cytochrome P450 monooxygenase n=1 Tax=Trametes versicolor TaxID=5325 RepID=A0AA86J4G0_TRAVE|nr:cytochrome P450 monooxygenase [Trametes versicolor]